MVSEITSRCCCNIAAYQEMIDNTRSQTLKQNSQDGVGVLVEWSERCASIPKIAGSNPSGVSELTFRSELLLTAIGGSTRALIDFTCLPCYQGNTLCSQRLEPPGRAGNMRRYGNPQIYFVYFILTFWVAFSS
jgi:hypothetical protein